MNRTPSTVAITGASGLIGRHLRPAMRDRPVTLLGRRPLQPETHETWAPFDLGGPVDLPSLSPGSALCHLAYAMTEGERNVDYTHRAIEAVNRSPSIEHVVMMSSASIYGASAGGVIDEDTRLRPNSPYARTKAACDRAWQELLRPDCRLTVLRPTSVIAPDGTGMDVLIRDALHHPLRGAVKKTLQRRSSVHFVAIDTIVAAVRFVLDRPVGAREIFVVSDDDDARENASYAAVQDHVRSLLGRRPLRAPPLPRPLQGPIGMVLGKPLGVRRTFSMARLSAAGFVAPLPLHEVLERTVRERTSPRSVIG